jgi:hypothetical protein
MDDYTNFIWSFFLKNKNDVADTMINFLLQLQKESYKLKQSHLHLTNSSKMEMVNFMQQISTQIINRLKKKLLWQSPLGISNSITLYWDMLTNAQLWMLQPITTFY